MKEDEVLMNKSFIRRLSRLISLILGENSEHSSFREFTDDNEAKRWGAKSRENVLLSNEEINNIYYYTGSWYRVIFFHLKRGNYRDGSDPDTDAEIDMLDGSINKGKIPDDIVVYRATRWKTLKSTIENNVVTPEAYWSTSLLLKRAVLFKLQQRDEHYDCILKIYLPKGSKGLYVSELKEHDQLSEFEVLLPRDSKFRIIKRRLFSRLLEVELIN